MELLSYLLNFSSIGFLIFRIYDMIQFSMSKTPMMVPVNWEAEVLVFFASVFCIFMIFKRNKIFGALFFSIYLGYYGYAITKILSDAGSAGPQGMQTFEIFVYAVAILLAFINFMDVLFNKNRTGSTKDRKTDWFYDTEEYTREKDERSDKNQYRIK